jgi:hypothetical protein
MSLYIEWLNRIKEKSSESWLTDSQKKAYDLVLTKWHSQPFINLYGTSGVGKTFIAHILVKEHTYFYSQDINNVSPKIPQVIVDDAQYDRSIRIKAHQLELGRILLISTAPVSEEAMPKLKLELEDKDLLHFQACLAKYCDITFLYTIPEGHSFSDILLKEIIARGEKQHAA